MLLGSLHDSSSAYIFNASVSGDALMFHVGSMYATVPWHGHLVPTVYENGGGG